MAVEPQVHAHLDAFGARALIPMITEIPHPIRALSFRDHDSVPLIEPVCTGMAYGATPAGVGEPFPGSTGRPGRRAPSMHHFRPLEPGQIGHEKGQN